MPQTDIGSAERSDLKTQFASGTENYYSVDTQSTDGASELKETKWSDTKGKQNLGYYKAIPEIRAVIDAKATWTIGKGFKTEEIVEIMLDKITGWGKDTFNTILENMIRTMLIWGNAYAEIIRDKEGNLVNLKTLDPNVMDHIASSTGMLKRFEQRSKVAGKKPKKYEPEKIFYLARNRVADEIHGVSMIEALTNIILMKNEAMSDWKRVLHRNIDPMMIFHLDTDNVAKIAAFKGKMDAARGKGENMYIPKDAVVPEQLSIAPNAALNPIAWIEMLDNKFYEAAGVPKIILGGGGGFTEAAVKIAYLAFQQTIEEEQLFIEEQALLQLGLEIELEFPASLENELLSDKAKDGAQNIDQSETTAGRGQ